MKRLWIVAAVVLAVSIALETAFRHLAHAEFWWQKVPGFDFAYGFLSCAVIVLGSKWIGHSFLQRGEGYYEHGPEPKRRDASEAGTPH